MSTRPLRPGGLVLTWQQQLSHCPPRGGAGEAGEAGRGGRAGGAGQLGQANVKSDSPSKVHDVKRKSDRQPA